MKNRFKILIVFLVLSFSLVLFTHSDARADYQEHQNNPPSIDGRYFQDPDQFGLMINDNGINLVDGLHFDEPFIFDLTNPAILKILVYDIDGWENIRYVNLYMNSDGDQITSRTLADTQIEFDHYGTDTVIDKSDFISNVSFSSQRYDPYDRYRLEVTFEIEFLNTMEKSDLIIYVVDKNGLSVERYLFNVISVIEEIVEQQEVEEEIMVVEIEEEYEIPYWVKSNAGFWSERLITTGEFVEGIEFMVKENIIKIPLLENQYKVKQSQVPDWVRTTSGWWSDELVSDKEFVNSLRYLINVGIITIPNINELISQS